MLACRVHPTVSAIRLAYVQSIQTVVDEMASMRGQKMNRLEFYEAVRRGTPASAARARIVRLLT